VSGEWVEENEPALERLVEQIRSHGQRASVDSRPTAISLSFTPEPTPGHSFAACTIGFSCEGSGDVSVTTTIYGKGGRQGGTSQQALASLTDEWVTRRVQEFVRTVLAGT